MAFSPETYVLLQGLIGKESEDVSDLKTRMTSAESDIDAIEAVIDSLDNNYLKITEVTVGDGLSARFDGLYNSGTDHTIITPVLHNTAATSYYGFIGLKSSGETRNIFLYWGSGSSALIPANLLNIVVRINKNDTVTWRAFSIDTVNFEVE